VRDDSDDHGGGDDEADGEQPNVAQVRAEVAPGREPTIGVEQRRQEDEEDEVGRQLDLRRPGTKPSSAPPSTSRIG
jgi:hypothetical protein